MTIVNSVLGPLNTADLGFTLTHEHVTVAPSGVFRDYPELFGTNPVDHAVNDLKKAKAGGVDTIVDATPLDVGREVGLLAEVSRRSGVNIIASTGWWMNTSPLLFSNISADQLAQVFTKDIEQGIAGTNIKAGILKAASDKGGVTPQEEIILRAVARTNLKTSVPIILHSYSPDQVGRRQLAILKEEGVNLKRVKVDHCSYTTDVEYLLWLLEQGCYLGFEYYGGNTSPLDRTRTMKALIDAGYAGRLCPSHDRIILSVISVSPEIEEKGLGYLYIKKVVFPQLQKMGASEEIIKSLCITSPRNFFEGV